MKGLYYANLPASSLLPITEVTMNPPQSEFTFFAPVSPPHRNEDVFAILRNGTHANVTPLATSRQSQNVRRSLPRTEPPPVFQFQDLNIASRSEFPAASASGSSPTQASILTPSRSTSTYADQHNASPSPASSRVATSRISQAPNRQSPLDSGYTVFTDAPERPVTELAASETHTGNIQMPGMYPESVLHSVRGVSRAPEESHNRTRQTIGQETLPSVPIYDSRLQAQLRHVKHKLSSLATSIGSSALVLNPSSNLHAHYQKVLKASNFEYPETRTVGFIGESGVGKRFIYLFKFNPALLTLKLGKSSLINSLLDQRGLSRSVGH